MEGAFMLERARGIEDQLVSWRREIHMYPEVGFQETRTAGFVADELESLGYRVQTGVGRTGVVGERGEGHPVVAIRADMDALPIQEENEVSYASRTPGVMHACGHDAHTAIALGVATLLAQETFPGTVRLLFQPAEEVEDEEGLSGAPRMAQDGAMDGVDAVMALHVDSGAPVGEISVDLAQLGDAPVHEEVGGLDTHLSVRRYPENPTAHAIDLDETVVVEEGGPTPYFVKVIQVDGHMAWSSPVYLESGGSGEGQE